MDNFFIPSYVTKEGGKIVKVINNTGGPSIKGYLCQPSSSLDNAVEYVTNGDIDPICVIYSDNVPNGEEIWVVHGGIAYVYYGTPVVRGTFSRVAVVEDGVLPGQAVNEPLPIPPFATDKHFQEIGHPLESRITPGLAKTMLHWN